MELEKQVCSLELAKKLKELGVNQESLFVYSMVMPPGHELIRRYETQPEIPGERYAAFTVAELGGMLPSYFVSMKNGDGQWFCGPEDEATYSLPIDKMPDMSVGYEWEVENMGELADTEANARAKMLIYLLENKLLEM